MKIKSEVDYAILCRVHNTVPSSVTFINYKPNCDFGAQYDRELALCPFRTADALKILGSYNP